MKAVDCEIPVIKVLKDKKHRIEGAMVFFYSSTNWIMRKIVTTVPDQTLQRIGKVITNTKTTKSVVFQSAWENPVVFSIFLFLLLPAGLLVFLLGLNFLCRIVFAKKNKEISATSMFWATLSFVVCVITSSIGMIIYSNSLDRIRTGIEILPQQLNTTTSDVTALISNASETIMCIYMKQSRKLNYEIGLLFDFIARGVEQFKNILSISRLRNVVHLVEQLSGNIEDMDLNQFGYLEKFPAARMHRAVKVILNLTSQLSSFKPSVVEFRLHVEDMFSEIDDNLKVINNTKKEIFREIADNMKIFGEVLQFVNRETVKLQGQLADIFTEGNFSKRLHDILGYTLLIPFALVFHSLIGLTGISISWTFYSSRDRHDSRKSRRGAFSMLAASTLTTAGYTAMFLGALLCLMTAFCFLMACCGLLICMGFFGDDDLRLFNAIPDLGYTADFSGQKAHYTLYEAFYTCKNGSVFFRSLNGSDVMAAQQQARSGTAFQRHNVSSIVGNFEVDRQFVESVSKALQAFKGAKDDLLVLFPKIGITEISSKQYVKFFSIVPIFLDHLSGLITELEKAEEMLLKFIYSVDQRVLFTTIKYGEITLQSRLLAAISTIFNDVVDMSPQCKNLMVIWNQFGKYLCDWITTPAQVLWLACTICFIGSLAIYHSLFNTAKFLQDFAELTQSECHARRRRRLKYDYLKKKMRMEEEGKTESPSRKGRPTHTKREQYDGPPKSSEIRTRSRKNRSFSTTTRSKEALSVRGESTSTKDLSLTDNQTLSSR